MDKKSIENFIKTIQTAVSKHSPEILTGIGITGWLTTTVLAVAVTPKALKLIEQEKNRQNRKLIEEAEKNGQSSCEQISKLKPIDVVKTTWKCYAPAVGMAAASTACLIGASSTNLKRNAALATAYKISESALTEYREKVIETIGEDKEREVRESIHKDRIEQNPVSKSEVIITEKGNTLCYDLDSKRYFKSDMNTIEKAVNEINRQMIYENYASLNDFYDKIGLEYTKIGGRLGWNIDMGKLEVYFSSQLTDDGKPCLAIEYSIPPKYDFDRLF